jgi:rhodanese-related sulfurtransferase
MAGVVTPRELKDMLHHGAESAVLDVREEGTFSQCHMLFPSPVPLSRLELLIRDLVPRYGTRIVLCDDGDGLAQRAESCLRAMGYGDVSILAGGNPAWVEAGFELFSGVHVPSKAFGEFIEVTDDTPHIPAGELKAMMDAGDNFIVLDSRPLDEYRLMNIPGSIDCPTVELPYRLFDLAPSPETTVVVNCAGRTRSIIGAQTLINAGVPNRVVALQNGTMGFHLAGFALEHGMERRPPAVSREGLAKARAMAATVAKRFNIKTIDHATLERWRGESAEQTLYLFDIRQPDEYEAGHLPGSLSIQGGQLVQTTDKWIGTRNARVVLVDDTGVRATLTAHWLMQMGLANIFVLQDALSGRSLATGPHVPEVPGLDGINVDEIDARDLSAALEAGDATVIDFQLSLEYSRGHIPGAWFAIRARLSDSMGKIPTSPVIVLTSPDGNLARLAAPDVQALSDKPIKVLSGGTAAWRAAGLPLAEGLENMADEVDDMFWRPYEKKAGVESSMNQYLNWELGLVEQIERDGTARFKRFPET